MGFGQEYTKNGVEGFYQTIGSKYNNPHAQDIKTLIQNLAIQNHRYLDLGAGDGIVTQALIESGVNDIIGCEPFLKDLYQINTNKPCFEFSFEDISKGLLKSQYDTIICSYAMHLVPASYLPNLLFNLSLITSHLVILSPHKRPEINLYWKEINQTKLNKTKMREFILE